MKIRIFFSIVCMVAALCACDDGIPVDLEFDQFKKVYLSAANDDAKTIALQSTRDTSFVFGNVAYGGTTYFGEGNIIVEIATDFSLVESYNTDHKTSYEPLPDESFAFDMTKLVIENGYSYSGISTLFLVPGELDTDKEYLLPVVIKSATGNVAVNEEKKTAYWAFVFSGDARPVEKDIFPLTLLPDTKNQMDIITGDDFLTLKSTGGDPYIQTSKLGSALSDGANQVFTFEYKSNKTVTKAELFYCVAGGPEGGKSSKQTITIPQASEWTRFEFDLSTAIDSFGFGVNNSGGKEPAEHFFRFDPATEADYEISIRKIQIEVYN